MLCNCLQKGNLLDWRLRGIYTPDFLLKIPILPHKVTIMFSYQVESQKHLMLMKENVSLCFTADVGRKQRSKFPPNSWKSQTFTRKTQRLRLISDILHKQM